MEFMQVIKKRKSVRSYQSHQITKEELDQIIYAGCMAPVSHKDYKSLKITVVQDQNLLHKISTTTDLTSDPLYGVPTLIIISTTKASVKNIEYLNVACIVENMLLSATNLNLGSIYLTYFLQELEKHNDLLSELGILKEFIPISAVGVGYPSRKERIQNGISKIPNNEERNKINIQLI